ncbi:TIGR03936 family radical SAM-associated protein [Nocardioides marinquilinus]|uniref:TIGR03936 family radical SAM-associated protein n=1 Tax=Nocardioides marinquilinus TaxID=1210400 RepID=A0ABP9PYN7_9ACTN
MSRQQPEQQAPPVQRLRVRYAKRGRLRFASHRDFSRSFERAVFRARIPMAYSSGFNPHPRISYAGAAPTGAASEAEYLEIALAEVCAPDDVRASLAEAMPDGLDVLAVADPAAGGGAPASLSDLLQASRWTLEVAAAPDETRAAVERLLAEESVVVERMTKKGLRAFDCRAAVVAVGVVEGDPDRAGARLDLVLQHTVPAVRPDDVLTGLTRLTGLEVGPAPLLTRVEQGPLVDDGDGPPRVGDPFAG